MGMNEAKDIGTKVELDCRKESPDYTSIEENTAKLVDLVTEAADELKKV